MANGSDRSWDTPPDVEGAIACIADWDPACGLHQGQQSFEWLHQQAEDKTASDPRQSVISSIAMREPSRQDIRAAADNRFVSRGSILDELSKRAPTIVAFTLFAALVADWINAPVVLPRGLAIIVGSLALALLATRGRRQLNAKKNLGFDSDIGWIAYELADKGTPQGFYVLGFFGVLTIVLTGVQSPYSLPAWAAFVLHIAWGMANARYPLDDE